MSTMTARIRRCAWTRDATSASGFASATPIPCPDPALPPVDLHTFPAGSDSFTPAPDGRKHRTQLAGTANHRRLSPGPRRLSAVTLLAMKRFLLAAFLATAVQAQVLTVVQTIPMPDVAGRIDHLSLDAGRRRLFVAALGNNSVEVLSLKDGQRSRSIAGFSEPQGVLFVPRFNRLFVANGGDGTVRILNARTFATAATLRFDGDADNLRYDDAGWKLYVGYGSGALGIINAADNMVAGSIPLPGHPEAFQLQKNGRRVFVNVPEAHAIVVVDRASRQQVARWSPAPKGANFPMALDEVSHRAFIAFRDPARLLVIDTESGREIAELPLHEDCDDVFFDAARRRIYASCGEGFIDVFTQTDPDHYILRDSVKTAPGARTSLFEDDRLYLAVPASAGSPARVEVFAPD